MIFDIDYGNRPWRKWWAWYPVAFSYAPYAGRRAWLEYVETRTENVQGYLIHSYRPFRGWNTL